MDSPEFSEERSTKNQQDRLKHAVNKGLIETAMVAMFVVVVLFFLPGCSAMRGGSRMLKQTDMDVSLSMAHYHNGVAMGRIMHREQEQVDRAYASYEAAYQQALQAANNDPNAPTPAKVKALASQVIETISTISFSQ